RSWRMSPLMKIGKFVFRSSRRGWSFLPDNGCAPQQTQKMLFKRRLCAFGAAIIGSTIALSFIPLSARLLSTSFDATSGALDVKSKFLQTLTDQSNLILNQGTIRSALLLQPSTTCRVINAKFWS